MFRYKPDDLPIDKINIIHLKEWEKKHNSNKIVDKFLNYTFNNFGDITMSGIINKADIEKYNKYNEYYSIETRNKMYNYFGDNYIFKHLNNKPKI